MSSVQAKIQLTTSPSLPGICACCGFHSNGQREFIDFGVSVDDYGAVALCIFCTKEAAATVGFIDPNELEECLKLLGESEQKVLALQEKLEAMESVVFTYRVPVGTGNRSGTGDLLDSDSNEGSQQGSLFA